MEPSPTDLARHSARRDRARRRGGDLFLYTRAFADCAEHVPSSGGRPLVVTAPGFEWTARAAPFDTEVRRLDSLEPRSADFIVAVGLLDHAEDPALAAFILHQALRPDGILLGATIGGRSLERLRTALLDAERATGRVAQRFRPLLDAPAIAAVLTNAGFRDAVIAVDRVQVAYRGLDRLVDDLRDMGCAGPAPFLSRSIANEAREHFLGGQARAEETFEILNFSATSGNAV